ncbi:hypothetical protein INR49_020622 [Caranx melampygus]|nr:hypothetical protein INR49_020622 [Caranx melampygus]
MQSVDLTALRSRQYLGLMVKEQEEQEEVVSRWRPESKRLKSPHLSSIDETSEEEMSCDPVLYHTYRWAVTCADL